MVAVAQHGHRRGLRFGGVMKLVLQPLPYAENALEPVISAATVDVHYHKHHAAYVQKTKELLGSQIDAYPSLESVISEADGRREDLFDQAGQAWNHDFFWRSMHPPGKGQSAPATSAADLINRDFGSSDGLFRDMLARGEAHFGSGWLWLAMDGTKLVVATTPNGRPLFTQGLYPLLACDLWEHAYYLDYQNRRKEFLEKFCQTLANWDFVETRLARRAAEIPPATAGHVAQARTFE
jgi:Fe-Mn family superoxide dismutase